MSFLPKRRVCAILSRIMTWAADRFVAAGIAAFAIAAAVTISPAHAAEPDAITRMIGLEMLRVRMLEQRAVDRQAPGYWGVGYDVRIG